MDDINNVKILIVQNKLSDLIGILQSGLDPNFENGWPIRMAARHGFYNTVKTLIQFGADPHLLGEAEIGTLNNVRVLARFCTTIAANYNATKYYKNMVHISTGKYEYILILMRIGASTLQLAVYSGEHWNTNKWSFLLSCCDSSQLADAAAVAVVFHNVSALQKILETGRCNTNIPTTLTGKTLEQLAQGYKLSHLLKTQSDNPVSNSPRTSRLNTSPMLTSTHTYRRNLSPSVARFFDQTVGQPALSPQRQTVVTNTSPISDILRR